MQRKILVSPKKGVGCRFQRIINHGDKRWYLHVANQNTTNQLLFLASQIKIPNHFSNTQCPCYYPLSKNPNAKQILGIKKKISITKDTKEKIACKLVVAQVSTFCIILNYVVFPILNTTPKGTFYKVENL